MDFGDYQPTQNNPAPAEIEPIVNDIELPDLNIEERDQIEAAFGEDLHMEDVGDQRKSISPSQSLDTGEY